jgi:putative transposase
MTRILRLGDLTKVTEERDILKRVARLARLAGIKAQIGYKRRPGSHTLEGFSYLAVVIDLYSRRVVGWSMQSRQTTDVHYL